MVTVGEILVRPFRVGTRAVSIAEGFLGHFADLDLVDVDYAVAREAARIRAVSDLRMPDALILATAMRDGIDRLCTNDQRLAAAAAGHGIAAIVTPLTPRQLNRATLGRQLLLRRERLEVVDAVHRIVAIQGQEPASPYVALWNRLVEFDPADLDRAFADRARHQGHAACGSRSTSWTCRTMRPSTTR